MGLEPCITTTKFTLLQHKRGPFGEASESGRKSSENRQKRRY